MQCLQREDLAGQLGADGGLQHQVRVLADAQDALGAQLVGREVAAGKHLRQRHQRLQDHLTREGRSQRGRSQRGRSHGVGVRERSHNIVGCLHTLTEFTSVLPKFRLGLYYIGLTRSD